MTDTGIGRGTAQGPRARRYPGSPREKAGSGRHRQANADKNEDLGSSRTEARRVTGS